MDGTLKLILFIFIQTKLLKIRRIYKEVQFSWTGINAEQPQLFFSSILTFDEKYFLELLRVDNGYKVTLMWVPSYVGIAGNERLIYFVATSGLPTESDNFQIEIRNHIPIMTLLMTTVSQSE